MHVSGFVWGFIVPAGVVYTFVLDFLSQRPSSYRCTYLPAYVLGSLWIFDSHSMVQISLDNR